jgi:exopolysaccharide biosynthesis polyprenyl glycosylphosphotransferase
MGMRRASAGRRATAGVETAESTEGLDLELAHLARLSREQAAKPGEQQTGLRGRHGSLRPQTLLLTADALAFLCAIVVLELSVIRFQVEDIGIMILIVPGVLCWAALAKLYGLYERDEISIGRSTIDDLPDLLLLSSMASWLGLLFLHLTGIAHPRLSHAAAFWLASFVFLMIGRAVVRWLAQAHLGLRQRTLIVGAGHVGRLIASKLAAQPRYGIDIVGFLDDDPMEIENSQPITWLGGTADFEQVVRARQIERVIVAFSRLPSDEQVDLCRKSLDLGVHVDIVPRMYEVIGWRNHFHSLDGIPLVALNRPQLSPTSRTLKRTLDVALAGFGLLITSPFLLYCAWKIKRESPGPVFFRQERMGAGGSRFQIMKFRTMYVDADARKDEIDHLNKHVEEGPRMFKIPDDPRVTPFGRFLRKWSLDEIPQLINVVRGEMSLVGPRPLILSEDENIIGSHRRRLQLTPGITGLWQVLGRSDVPFAEMITLDYLYVTNWSLWSDIKLLSHTVPAVLRQRGAY